jgi:hypothetical protein
MFHEGGCVSNVFAKRISLPGRLLGIVAPGPFVPIHFQEKCAVTGWLQTMSLNLARMFHEGGCVCHPFAKQINLMAKHLGIFAQGQFAPIHFQEKCAVTA